MHVLIINFNLEGITEEQYRGLCDELAPKFAALPGLESKTWLADAETNTYGGVYMFRDRESFEGFVRSDLGVQVSSSPNLANFTMRDFGVLEAPSAVTNGLIGAPA